MFNKKSLSHFNIQMLKKYTFNPLRDILDEGRAKEKGVVNRLILVTMSDFEKAFYTWNQFARR
jgi:hypothetical protein